MKKVLFFTFIFYALTLRAGLTEDMQEANNLYFSAKPAAALEKYKKISKDTNNRDAFLNAAFIALELNKPKEAVDIMSAAYKLFPSDETVQDFLGEAYLADGQFLSAEKIYSALLENTEKENFFYTNLARSQTGMDEGQMAELNFKSAAKGTQVSFANYMLCSFYEKQKKYAEAVKACSAAVIYDHQFIEARKKYADVLIQTKDYNEAWKQLRTVYLVEKDEAIKKQMDAIAHKRTKTEGEILKPKEILKHTFVKRIVSLDENYPMIKVALGAQANGSPSVRSTIDFSPSNDFRIFKTKTDEFIINGNAKENWKAVLENGKAYIVDPKGKRTAFTGSIIIKQNSDAETGHSVIIKKLSTGAGMTWASSDDKEFRGDIEIAHNTTLNTLVPINHVNIEEYLFGVIASEMPTSFPLDALRAQAVLSRSYTLKHLGKHKKWGYDVCDTQHCQVYGGVQSETEKTNAAVESTAGEILSYKNKPVEAVFSANCGGFTQSSKDAGWSAIDYLTPQSDYKDFDFLSLQPFHFKDLLQHEQDAYSAYKNKILSPAAYRWVRVVDVKTIQKNVAKRNIGEVTGISIESRARSGYVSKVRVTGTKGSAVFDKENTIKRNLALGMLRSTYFYIQPVYEKKKLKEFVIFGGGWGHGVGFCQTGAGGRAQEGQGYQEILRHYFPITTLENIQNKKE